MRLMSLRMYTLGVAGVCADDADEDLRGDMVAPSGDLCGFWEVKMG